MAIRDHQSGITDIMERLKVKPISQYLAQRKINWLFKIFHMEATRLPRILLMAEALPNKIDHTDQMTTLAPSRPPPGPDSALTGTDHAPSEHKRPILNTDPKEDAFSAQ